MGRVKRNKIELKIYSKFVSNFEVITKKTILNKFELLYNNETTKKFAAIELIQFKYRKTNSW